MLTIRNYHSFALNMKASAIFSK